MSSETKSEAAAILEALRYCRPAPWVIAIAGIPGAGKSTVAADVASRVAGAAVIPMDGYHLPRSVLSADGLARRGAPDTFDPSGLRGPRETSSRRPGILPGVRPRGEGSRGGRRCHSHRCAPGDRGRALSPAQRMATVALVRLYCLPRLRSRPCADRVAARHLQCGLAATASEARNRADTNDRRNALNVLADDCPALGGSTRAYPALTLIVPGPRFRSRFVRSYSARSLSDDDRRFVSSVGPRARRGAA